jgi:hypothetical protein
LETNDDPSYFLGSGEMTAITMPISLGIPLVLLIVFAPILLVSLITQLSVKYRFLEDKLSVDTAFLHYSIEYRSISSIKTLGFPSSIKKLRFLISYSDKTASIIGLIFFPVIIETKSVNRRYYILTPANPTAFLARLTPYLPSGVTRT